MVHHSVPVSGLGEKKNTMRNLLNSDMDLTGIMFFWPSN